MKKTYQLNFQKIRRLTQLKDIMSFERYFNNIFSDLAERLQLYKNQGNLINFIHRLIIWI